MKTKLILFLICLFTLSAVGETGPIRKVCKTCQKPVANCPYHGNHPKKPEPKPEATCKSCGKPLSKCPHKGKHPVPPPEATCKSCKKPLSQCPHNGKHPVPPKPEATCKSCKMPLSKCQYNGKHPTTGTLNGHEWVDLGLPSGTKWATTNVGASLPSDYGDYFAWGETSTKSAYNWDLLKYCLDSEGKKFSKYVTYSEFGSVDGKSELAPSDDAAYVNWGSWWRMPSIQQTKELKEKCQWTWTTMGGHKGFKVVGPNGNFIFLPAAGYRSNSDLGNAGSFGAYWSSSLSTSYSNTAYDLYFNSDRWGWSINNRDRGLSVRAVCP